MSELVAALALTSIERQSNQRTASNATYQQQQRLHDRGKIASKTSVIELGGGTADLIGMIRGLPGYCFIIRRVRCSSWSIPAFMMVTAWG